MTAVPLRPPTALRDDSLPHHVRTAFGVREEEPRPIVWAGRAAWRLGEVVIRPVADNAVAAWAAGVLDTLHVDGVRPARPVRSSDGRWVVAGWAASRFVPTQAQLRHDAVVAAADALNAATEHVERPRLADDHDDLLVRCAAAAFGERRLSLDPGSGGTLYGQLAAYRATVRTPSQVVHPELFGAVMTDHDGVPVVGDLVPCWRPRSWAAAVVVVDALAWGGADDGLLLRWSLLPDWPQMALRAVLYRLALHAQHPDASSSTFTGLERAAGLVSALL